MVMKRTPSRAWLAGSLSWILFFLAPVSASCLGNAIPEGEFESTIAPWHLHQEKGAQASSALDAAEGASCGKAAKVSVDKAGEAHHVQFFCNFPSSALSPGEPYRLRFIAKAKPARVFSVRVMHCQRPWSNVGLETEIEAENEWREFDLLFRLRGNVLDHGYYRLYSLHICHR